MELMVTAARDDGTTVVLVTHEPRVAAYADREVVVRDGRVTLDARTVIRLGLRLSTRGGKESLVRLVVMALAVAVGVAMLLLTLATINGLGKQNARGAWMATTPAAQVGFPQFGGPSPGRGHGWV